MSHAIIDIDTFMRAMLVADDVHTADVQLCIDGASDAIERWTNRRFLTADYEAWHDGTSTLRVADVYRADLYLADPDNGFATLPVSAVTAVEEDGVALTPILMHAGATLVDGESAVIFKERGIIRRATVSSGSISYTSWATGIANVRVEYTAGYALEAMPESLQRLCIHLTNMIYRESFRGGIASQVDMGASVSYERLLPPWAKDIIASFQLPGSPRTLAG